MKHDEIGVIDYDLEDYDNEHEDKDNVSGDRWVIETDGLLVKNVTG